MARIKRSGMKGRGVGKRELGIGNEMKGGCCLKRWRKGVAGVECGWGGGGDGAWGGG